MKRIKHWQAKAAEPTGCQEPLVVGPVALHLAARRVLVEGYLVHLPASEAALLAKLMRNPGRVLTEQQLCVGANQAAGTGGLPRLTRRLSRRLAVSPLLPRLIERVGPDGYRFVPIHTD